MPQSMATQQNKIAERTKLELFSVGQTLEAGGQGVLRYGLVVILFWIGALKFTAYEAEGLIPLVSNSPLMSWGYQVMSVRSFSMLIGAIEITIGILIALRRLSPVASAVGSLASIGMFLVTLSFVFTTPGVWQDGYGFPFPSPMPGQFLAKDILFLGAAIWSAGEALCAAKLQGKITGSNTPAGKSGGGIHGQPR